MLTKAVRTRRIFTWAIVMAIAAGLGGPPSAHAGRRGKGFKGRQAKALKCQVGRTLVRTDKKVCPATKFRPPLTVSRACCEAPNGKRQCRSYPGCPPRSPSV